MFVRHDQTPKGLVDSWYKSGSFPSGHTIKSVFFFLFVLTSGVMSPYLYLLIVVPLLFFRILVGFHYPIDLYGGVIIGYLAWLVSRLVTVPNSWTQLVRQIFDTVFFIK
jgi:membrane-associated phospholipid phosphatase